MIEAPPKEIMDTKEIIYFLSNQFKYKDLIDKIQNEYLYYDKVKYLVPEGISPTVLWNAIKILRNGNYISFGRYRFFYYITNNMQKILHEFDMSFGGTLVSEHIIPDKNKQYYLISSIMEEAIASSKMEGASTTRKVAKEMLRKQTKPKNKDQQMILNNYKTIQFLVNNKDKDLSPDFLLEIHSMISDKTLESQEFEGCFRNDNNIFVVDNITGTIAHTPPDYKEIDSIIRGLCDFANSDKEYIHPIIKAIIIHFTISFLHPFVDGNGRTARALFYWYMLKKGYWTTEYLSISRVISRKRGQYEKAFLYTEKDNFDLGYFIQYNLDVMNIAYGELKKYLNRKIKEQESLYEFSSIKGINERQAFILKMLLDNPKTIFVSKDFENTLGVSVKTIRSDLKKLTDLEYMETINLNQRLVGYRKSFSFDKKLREIRGN